MALTKKDLKESLAAQRKDITKDIETAVAQIVDAVIKHTASKEEVKGVKGELSEKIDTVKSELSS